MPDISLLVEIAEFFDVSIPEIINGERKSETMKEEVKEVAETLSDYAAAEKENMIKNIRIYSLIGALAAIVYCVLDYTELIMKNTLYENIALYCQTLVFVSIILIFAHTTGVLNKLHKKQKTTSVYMKFETLPKPVQMILGAIAAFVVAVIIKLFLVNILGL